MPGLLLSEVHGPEARPGTGALNYTLHPYQPPLYSDVPTPPEPDPVHISDGNDYLQASCDGTVVIGMVVQANPSTQAGIVLQPATSDNPQPALGIVVNKLALNQANVQTDGIVSHGLSGLIPGANYYVGQNGALRLPPLDGVVFAQLVGQAQSETTLSLANNGQVFKRETRDDGEDQGNNGSP